MKNIYYIYIITINIFIIIIITNLYIPFLSVTEKEIKQWWVVLFSRYYTRAGALAVFTVREEARKKVRKCPALHLNQLQVASIHKP